MSNEEDTGTRHLEDGNEEAGDWERTRMLEQWELRERVGGDADEEEEERRARQSLLKASLRQTVAPPKRNSSNSHV